MADAVHVELEACRAAEQEIKRLKDVMGGGESAADANDQIANTVSSLPGTSCSLCYVVLCVM